MTNSALALDVVGRLNQQLIHTQCWARLWKREATGLYRNERRWQGKDQKAAALCAQQLEVLLQDNDRLREGLRYALSIIDSYALDIRSRPDLVAAGFCQGEIYREARLDITKRVASPAAGGENSNDNHEHRPAQ